jgi:hypothetical protein
MKDFDVARKEREERDRGFQIGGETFTCRAAVAPQSVMRWGKMTAGEFYARDTNGNVVVNPVSGRPLSVLTEEEILEIFDETVVAFLEPGQQEKWEAVRAADAKHPVNLDDLTELIEWLWEQSAGHPTGEPSGSTDGGASPPTETRSTEGSSLQVVTG